MSSPWSNHSSSSTSVGTGGLNGRGWERLRRRWLDNEWHNVELLLALDGGAGGWSSVMNESLLTTSGKSISMRESWAHVKRDDACPDDVRQDELRL
jgi:hypothetical protein